MTATAEDDDLALAPWVGHLFGGRYRLVAAIGAGGMGVVYRAWDLAADRYVVAKMPKRELLGEPKFLQRFEQELSALRSLSHPSVVPVVDVGNEQGTPFAVMPYLAGGSLKQRRLFTRDGQAAPEPPANLWRWLPAVARSLDFVHASGYVHRDVKPDNILFDGPGTPFLSDFGVAKIVLQSEDETASRGLTGTGMALGTPAYMAPELISGARPSPQVDQYALAVTIYELLAARKPFDGPTPAAVILAHVTGNAPPLASLLPGLPAALSDAVARSMARDPGDRFGSCLELATAALAALPQPSAAEKLQLMCPRCSRLLNVKPDWAGKQGNCPKCKSAMAIGADLKSLWLQGDRLGTALANDTLPVALRGVTPPPPVPVPVFPSLSSQQHSPRQPPSPSLLPTIMKAVAAACSLLMIAFIAMTWSGDGKAKARTNTRPPNSSNRSADELVGARQQEPAPPPPAEPMPVRRRPLQAEDHESQPTVVAAASLDELPLNDSADMNSTIPDALSADGVTTTEEEPSPSKSVSATPHAESAARPRLPPLTDKQLATAVATVKEAYEEEYTQPKQRGWKTGLAEELAAATRESNDPQAVYALFAEASRLFAEDLEITKALAVCRACCGRYDEDPATAQMKVLDAIAKLPNRVSPQCFERTMAAATDRLTHGDVEVADAAVSVAMGIARMMANEQAAGNKPMRGRKPQPTTGQLLGVDADALLKEATLLQTAVATRKRVQDAAATALVTLETDPDDKAAHAAVGRYLCLVKESWTEGLSHLAASDIDMVAPLAARQLESGRAADPQTAYELAGAWWDLAEDAPESLLSKPQREAIRRFAGRMYAVVRSRLDDPLDTRVAEKRQYVVEEPVSPEPIPFAALAGPGTPATASPAASAEPAKASTAGSTSSTKVFSARANPDLRRKLLESLGGSAASEAAVDAGLKWLASHQLPDGGWSFDLNASPGCEGKCSNSVRGSHVNDRCAATGLALLCFYGRGYTHREGPYKLQVKQGTSFLANLATTGNGKCYGTSANLYSQGVAGIALAEAYALTKDRQLRAPAQACLNYIMQAQDPEGGGWRYSPRQAGDTSASGWQYMALAIGSIGGLQVDPLVVKRYQFFLDSVQEDGGAAYGYTDRGNGLSTSAIGLLCRCSMGWPANDPRIQAGGARLSAMMPSSDVYSLYYCSQLLLRTKPAGWNVWNAKTRNTLVTKQARTGHADGSWHEGVSGGHGAYVGGRLYCTAMATLTLENYYRYVSQEDLAE